MASEKLLVVFGATGNQGGSVINSILGDPNTASQFSLRAITRDPSKPSAQALTARGVECVQADLNNKDSVVEALKGAHSVFAVTNFWETASPEIEIQQGKNIADAAKAAGVRHLIWSSLLNVTTLSKGKYRTVRHYDSKAEVEEYIRGLEIPATFFLGGFFMSNFPGQLLNNFQGGPYNITMPIPGDSLIPLFDAARDTGKFVKGILLNRCKLLGARVYGATDYYTLDQIFKTFQEVKPEASSGGAAVQIPDEVFKGILASQGMPEIVQVELLENMQLMADFGYFGGVNLNESRSILTEPLTTWKAFVEQEPAWANLK